VLYIGDCPALQRPLILPPNLLQAKWNGMDLHAPANDPLSQLKDQCLAFLKPEQKDTFTNFCNTILTDDLRGYLRPRLQAVLEFLKAHHAEQEFIDSTLHLMEGLLGNCHVASAELIKKIEELILAKKVELSQMTPEDIQALLASYYADDQIGTYILEDFGTMAEPIMVQAAIRRMAANKEIRLPDGYVTAGDWPLSAEQKNDIDQMLGFLKAELTEDLKINEDYLKFAAEWSPWRQALLKHPQVQAEIKEVDAKYDAVIEEMRDAYREIMKDDKDEEKSATAEAKLIITLNKINIAYTLGLGEIKDYASGYKSIENGLNNQREEIKSEVFKLYSDKALGAN
jgi:predicted house-cleaning NTP pyrophosphatase (Maf/HAM1 superfamily)